MVRSNNVANDVATTMEQQNHLLPSPAAAAGHLTAHVVIYIFYRDWNGKKLQPSCSCVCIGTDEVN